MRLDQDWIDFVGFWNEEHEDDQIGDPPSHKEVCPTCKGNGVHVNPAIDGHGLDPRDPDLDEDFWDDYRSGVYNVTCENCGGMNVIEVLDEGALREDVGVAWEEWQREMWESYSISAQERAMGA